MKKTIFSLFFTLCTAFVALAFSVHADTALQLSVAADGGDYKTVESALSAVSQMAAKGELNDKGVCLVLTGEHTATVKDKLLFGQKTIFLPDGRKLPITIKGGILNLTAEHIVCANDYTFTNITIPLDDVATKLYAGSGNVTLDNVTTDKNGKAEYKSYLYGDNYSANAFAGWTEESLALYSENGLFVSSMTLGENFVYKSSNNAAVGSKTNFSAKVGSKTVSAETTCPKLIIDGATVENVHVRTGTNPTANSVLHVKGGHVAHVYAITKNTTSIEGDVTVICEGGTYSHFVRILNATTLNGNLNVTMKNVDLSVNPTTDDAQMIEIGFGGASVLGDVNVYMENVKADRYYGSLAGKSSKVTGDVSLTMKNCEFSRFIRGGFGQTPIYGNCTNNFENVLIGPEHFVGIDNTAVLGKAAEYTGKSATVGNLTNVLKNVTFATPETEVNSYLGSSASCTIAGNITNTLDNVITNGKLNLYCASASGKVLGNVTNTIKEGTYSYYLYGGPNAGTVQGNIINYVQGGTYLQETYLGGHNCTIAGQIKNYVSGGNFTTLYLFCGTRAGNVTNKEHPYGIENYFTGGNFVGVWGGGGNSITSTLTANVYNEISGGHFGVYNYQGKINSFAGSVRNGTHNANVDTLILGGVFEGYVCGGSIPNQEDWGHEHAGTSTLTIAGGEFRYMIDADCRWGTYNESHLYVNTQKALEPLSLAYNLECESFTAASETIPAKLTGSVVCGDLIVQSKIPFQVLGNVVCENFIVKDTAASPEIYGNVVAKNLDCKKPLIIGAKASITADSVSGGSIKLHQNEYWLAGTYFTSPANTKISVSQSNDVFGDFTVENGVVKGTSSAFEGVSFVFDDKIALRFYFNREWVDNSKDTFTFRATCGDRVLVEEASFDDLTLNGKYYTILSDDLSATELCRDITATGSLMENRRFTLLELAEMGIRIYGKEGQNDAVGNLLKAFSNYAVASDNYKNSKSTPLPYENKTVETGFVGQTGYAPIIDTPLINITDKQIILDDGMRVRYYLQSINLDSSTKSRFQKLNFFHNCENITKKVSKTWHSTGYNKGYYTATVDLPIYPSMGDARFRFIVAEKDDLHNALPVDSTEPYTTYVSVDYVDRLDSIAEQVAASSEGSELGSALLYYLQAGAEYYDTQPDISDFTYPEEFSAGYAREDFSPYGDDMDMYSGRNGKVVLDPMYVTCLALWDGDELALIYSLDFRGVSDSFAETYKKVLKSELKDLIDPDKIFFNATHDHSGPNASSMDSATVKVWYKTIFDDALMRATKRAILDLAPSQLYTGKATSEQGTNFVRRYVRADGSITGIHNIIPTTNIVGYETEADKELRTLRFTREGKKDIVYANWQGHAAHGAAYRYQFTADFIHWMREGVEADMDVLFMYANGASGNLNFTGKLSDTPFTSPYFTQVGKSLVGTVKKAVAAEKKIETGEFMVTAIPFLATVKHEDEATVEKAKAANELLKAYKAENGSDMPASQIQSQTGFQSKYEISHIITRSGMGETATIPVYAFSFGDVAMSFVPFEQFDSNAKQTRDSVQDLYEVTFTCAYSNGSKSYIPSAYAAPHGGYEVYSSRYVDSTGDDIAFALRDALRAMREN